VRQALIRELQEELGITVTACSPWLTRVFTYPHATVRLNFWRVTAWDGEIGITAPLEHSCGRLAEMRQGGHRRPDPAGQRSDPESAGAADDDGHHQWPRAKASNASWNAWKKPCTAGLRLIQVRDKGWPPAQRLWFAEAFHPPGAQPRRAGRHQRRVRKSPAASVPTACTCRLRAWPTCAARPDFTWVGASCHSAAEIARAGELDLDYALLGPVLPTPTHPESPASAGRVFARRLAGNTLPVFAWAACRRKCWPRRKATAHTASRLCAAGRFGDFAPRFVVVFLHRNPVGIVGPAAEIDLLAAFGTERAPRILRSPQGISAALRTADLAHSHQRLQKVLSVTASI
jgi:8-oxo-dGTP diphosphatase